MLPGWNRLHCASARTRADARDAAQIRERRRRPGVGHGRERQLHVPAQAVVQRQRRRHAPRVLRVEVDRVHPRRLVQVAEVDVLAGVRIETRGAGHARDAAGQDRVDVARFGQVVVRRAGEVRRR